MRTFWIVQAGIGVAGSWVATAFGVACSGTIVGTGTEPVNATDTDTEPVNVTDTATDTETETDTGSSLPPSCYECACVNESGDTPAGCADTCSNNGPGGTTTPNFCNGAPALSMCTLCIAAHCGVSDPTQCN